MTSSGIKTSHRLAQNQSSQEVLCNQRPLLQRKDNNTLVTIPAPFNVPFNVLDNSVADVSFLVGLLVDEFLYHPGFLTQLAMVSK